MAAEERIKLTPEEQLLDQEILGFIEAVVGQYINTNGPIKPPLRQQGVVMRVMTKDYSGVSLTTIRDVAITHYHYKTSIDIEDKGFGRIEAYTRDPGYDESQFNLKPCRPRVIYYDESTHEVFNGRDALTKARQALKIEQSSQVPQSS